MGIFKNFLILKLLNKKVKIEGNSEKRLVAEAERTSTSLQKDPLFFRRSVLCEFEGVGCALVCEGGFGFGLSIYDHRTYIFH